MGGKSKSLCLSHNLKKYGELSLVMMGGKSKFQLAKWEKICLPKVFGGWGINSLQWFNHALYLKSLWCGLFGPSLWTEVFLSKYLKKYSMEYCQCTKSLLLTGTYLSKTLLLTSKYLSKTLLLTGTYLSKTFSEG